MPARGVLTGIGITGGMGSGKSSVAALLAESAGALSLSADCICRDLLAPGGAGWLALRQAFGDRFLRADGTVDRPGLRTALFADASLRHALDALLHPLARERVHAQVGEALAAGKKVVVEVPLLYEAGWSEDFSRVVVVYADASVCISRLAARDRLSVEEAGKAIAAQLPLADKAMRADHVIDNSGCWWETCLQVDRLRRQLWPACG
ncbi:MAG: dephospho-CoA kinase [Thermodesulfobacteriota bacterium]